MKYNYHTHTKRCGHAIGDDREYVLSAIKNGYKILGFSDHVMIPGVVSNLRVRGDYSLKEEYLHSIDELKKEFKDQITIYCGFECEWDRRYASYYRTLLLNKEVDYLIFGNHAIYFSKGREKYINVKDKYNYLNSYLNKSIQALNSGLFKVYAHPDLFMMFTGWTKKCEEITYRICNEAKKNNVALELNAGRIITLQKKDFFGEVRYPYPYPEFWKIVKEVGNKIVIGLDAHDPSAFSSEKLNEVQIFIKKLGLRIVDKLEI